MKLITAATRYVREGRRLRSPYSRVSFLNIVRRLHEMYPEHSLTDFTLNDLRDFCYSGKGRVTPEVSPATVNHRKNLLGPFFGWCHFQNFIRVNPAQHISKVVQPGRARVIEGVWLSLEQIGELYRSFDVSTPYGRRNRLVFVLMATVGLRRVEVGRLRWSHFSADFSRITVLSKGNKLETVPVPPPLRVELEAWRAEVPTTTDYVLPSMHVRFNFETGIAEREVDWDTPLGKHGVYDIIKKLSDDYGVKFRPHDLRRSFAGILVAQNVPIDQIRDLMRHEHLSTTDAYLSRNPERLESTVEGVKWAI